MQVTRIYIFRTHYLYCGIGFVICSNSSNLPLSSYTNKNEKKKNIRPTSQETDKIGGHFYSSAVQCLLMHWHLDIVTVCRYLRSIQATAQEPNTAPCLSNGIWNLHSRSNTEFGNTFSISPICSCRYGLHSIGIILIEKSELFLYQHSTCTNFFYLTLLGYRHRFVVTGDEHRRRRHRRRRSRCRREHLKCYFFTSQESEDWKTIWLFSIEPRERKMCIYMYINKMEGSARVIIPQRLILIVISARAQDIHTKRTSVLR